MLLALLLLAPMQSTSEVHGTAGVCVRWGSDPKHVEEAIVVEGTGNAALDAGLPESITRMEWARPTSPTYHGEWIGMTFAVGEEPTKTALPDCSKLAPPKPKA